MHTYLGSAKARVMTILNFLASILAAATTRVHAVAANVRATLMPTSLGRGVPSMNVVGYGATSRNAFGNNVSRRTALAMLKEDKADIQVVKDIAVGVILLVVSYVIALSMWPILTAAIATAQADGNTTTTQSTLLGLIGTIVIVILVVLGIGYLFRGLQSAFGGRGGNGPGT